MLFDEQKKKNREKIRAVLATGGLIAFVCLSFLLPFFTRVFSGYVYAALLLLSTLTYAFSEKKAIAGRNKYAQFWLVVVIVMNISFLRTNWTNGAFLDMLVFVCGLILVFLNSAEEKLYVQLLATMQIFALFYGIGVFLQYFLPPVHLAIVRLFPPGYRRALFEVGCSGFTLNPGYSAGFIIAGLIATLADFKIPHRNQIKDLCILLFLVVALPLTGKRGPIVFFVCTLIYCYLSPAQNLQKLKRYWKIILAIAVTAVLFEAYRESLTEVPLVKRVVNSIEQYHQGRDISSGRLRLYEWAWELFERDPMLGAGWGSYRAIVAKKSVLGKGYEVHNIYLQLLCETGLLGFACFIVLFLLFWNTARVEYSRILSQKNNAFPSGWRGLLYFSFAYQTFFLSYGLTGNPLYDSHFQMMYIIACMMLVAYKKLQAREAGLSPNVPHVIPIGNVPFEGAQEITPQKGRDTL